MQNIYIKYDFNQFVQYYNKVQQLLLNDKVSVDQKRAILELIHDMTVMVKTPDEEKKYANLLLSLFDQITSLTPEKQRKSR